MVQDPSEKTRALKHETDIIEKWVRCWEGPVIPPIDLLGIEIRDTCSEDPEKSKSDVQIGLTSGTTVV